MDPFGEVEAIAPERLAWCDRHEVCIGGMSE